MPDDIVALKPLPWLLVPKALAGVTVQLKSIIVRPKNIPDRYPYEPNPQGSHRILYRQFIGDTLPPEDVGDPGDLWIVKKSSSQALYARSDTQWTKWPGFRVLLEQLIPHPNLEDRFLSYSKESFKWYAFSTIKNESRARGHSLCASEIVAAFLDGDMDRQRTERSNAGSQSQKNIAKRKKIDESDEDESDGEYRYGSGMKRVKQEPDSEVMRQSKVAAKQRRRKNEIRQLQNEIEILGEEKAELHDSNKELQTTIAHLEDKNRDLGDQVKRLFGREYLLDQIRKLQAENQQMMRYKPVEERKIWSDGRGELQGQSIGRSDAESGFNYLTQDTLSKVSEKVGRNLNEVIGVAVSICEERQKAEVAEKKVADLQKQVHLQSRAHAARIDEEHALETDFNRKKALLTKELERSVTDLEKATQERNKLRVRVEILTEENRELRDSKVKDQQKHERDMQRLCGM